MSWTDKQRITVIAIVLLMGTMLFVWQIGDVRTAQVMAEQRSELVNESVTTRQAPNDYDGDGFADATDRCPTRPETDNGFQDSDGCPDIVETTGAS